MMKFLAEMQNFIDMFWPGYV